MFAPYNPKAGAESRTWLVWFAVLIFAAWLLPAVMIGGDSTSAFFLWYEFLFAESPLPIPASMRILTILPVLLAGTYLGIRWHKSANVRALVALIASAVFFVACFILLSVIGSDPTTKAQSQQLTGGLTELLSGLYMLFYMMLGIAAFVLLLAGAVARQSARGTWAGAKLSLFGAIAGGLVLVLPVVWTKKGVFWGVELVYHAFGSSGPGMPNFAFVGVIATFWMIAIGWMSIESLFLARSDGEEGARPTRIIVLHLSACALLVLGISIAGGQFIGKLVEATSAPTGKSATFGIIVSTVLVTFKLTLIFFTHQFGLGWSIGKLVALNELNRGDADSLGSEDMTTGLYDPMQIQPQYPPQPQYAQQPQYVQQPQYPQQPYQPSPAPRQPSPRPQAPNAPRPTSTTVRARAVPSDPNSPPRATGPTPARPRPATAQPRPSQQAPRPTRPQPPDRA